jgi:hypothetical protein
VNLNIEWRIGDKESELGCFEVSQLLLTTPISEIVGYLC